MRQNNIELIILGSGTCIPSLERGAPGLLLKIDTEIVLFDSGSGTINKLLKLNADCRDLSHIFYTHTHPDHTADLVPILQARMVASRIKHINKLDLYGPSQFSIFIDYLAKAYGSWIGNPDLIKMHELIFSQVDLPFAKITSAPMKHSNHSIGYRIDVADKSITYSGDTDYCEEIITLAHQSDILVLECSFPDEEKMEGHLSPTLSAKIASESKCKHLILTHFYPLFEGVDIIKLCRKYYDGKISLAYDLMRETI